MAGFLSLMGRYLVDNFLKDQPSHTQLLLAYIFMFMAFPFIPIGIHFFYSLIREILAKEISLLLRRINAAFWGVFFLALFIAMKKYMDYQDDSLASLCFPALNYLPFLFYIILTIPLFFGIKDISDKHKKKAITGFGFMYIIGFSAVLLFSGEYIGRFVGRDLLTIFVYFSFNLPPLLLLRQYLNKHELRPQLQPIIETDLAGFFLQYEISKREQEIIFLMLKGNSNADITKELYISLHTVKNHIYSIYQKLEVKNRLQIAQLIRNHLQHRSG